MNKHRDYLYRYEKAGCPGIEGRCRVRVYLPQAMDLLGLGGGDRPVVVCSEPTTESGYEGPSVTNEAELIACGVMAENPPLAEAARSREHSPPFWFVEHYPRGEAEERAGIAETFDLVTFAAYEPVRWGITGRGYYVLGAPDWEHATKEQVERLTGERLDSTADAAYFGLQKTRGAGGDEPAPGYTFVETEHGMLPPLEWHSGSGDVRLRRVADFEAGLDLRDQLPHRVQTNVPWSVVEHSPSGFEWGYAGSGPADLALNILNLFEPPGSDGEEEVLCFRGQASRVAYELHQAFKEDFIACLPWEGDVIPGWEIRAWISARVLRAGGRSVAFGRRGM